MSMKNSNDTIGKQTRYLPTCSAVPQPTAPPRAPTILYTATKFLTYFFTRSVAYDGTTGKNHKRLRHLPKWSTARLRNNSAKIWISTGLTLYKLKLWEGDLSIVFHNSFTFQMPQIVTILSLSFKHLIVLPPEYGRELQNLNPQAAVRCANCLNLAKFSLRILKLLSCCTRTIQQQMTDKQEWRRLQRPVMQSGLRYVLIHCACITLGLLQTRVLRDNTHGSWCWRLCYT
jgi:hypothetical protein